MLIASVSFSREGWKDWFPPFPIYPSYCQKGRVDYPDINYLDAVLESRLSDDTEERYYCWKELISKDSSFTISGNTFVPSEPIVNVMSYPSALVNGGLIIPPHRIFS